MKYIITDPCYLKNTFGEWDAFLEATSYGDRLDKPHKMNRGATIHAVRCTPNGDCSFEEDGRNICCDAGMFCVASVSDSVAKAQGKTGKFYPTLADALADFSRVILWADRGGDPENEDEESYY